jgi:hypothetical protein
MILVSMIKIDDDQFLSVYSLVNIIGRSPTNKLSVYIMYNQVIHN